MNDTERPQMTTGQRGRTLHRRVDIADARIIATTGALIGFLVGLLSGLMGAQ